MAAACFSIKGSVHEEEHGKQKRKAVRLIKHDGGMMTYDRPIKALQVMEEFPKQMVCRADSFYIGQKTSALSQHDRLLPGHNYFLLPADFFQSTLSFASFLRCRSNLGASAFEIEKTPSGSLRIKVSENYLYRKQQQEQEAGIVETIITTPRLRKDYDQLVVLARLNQWKPKLDTIAEKKSSKRRKKKKNEVIN